MTAPSPSPAVPWRPSGPGGLVVVANRLPVRWVEETREWKVSPGGLVSALAPVLGSRGGTWVGWTGSTDGRDGAFEADGIRQQAVPLSADEVENYYEGFCNGTVWPLYHDAIRAPEFHRHWWRPFRGVNRRFADAARTVAQPEDVVWVQDYQLQLVPAMLREGFDGRIGFFLHIPFPPPEVFARLPWREQVVKGLLGADVVGFQTHRSMLNFARAARAFGGAMGPADRLVVGDRFVKLESVPISIDARSFSRTARRTRVRARAEAIRREFGTGGKLVLGVDRLDYTKGIDLRLDAFETLLEQRPDLHGRVRFIQVAVPSREGVSEYQTIRERIEQLVGRINGDHGRPGWVPVHYLYRSLDREELIAYYLAADVMLVTPLRDGMNLVAKEYVATRTEGTGVLVLSEFAGAAEQLRSALIVNPYDLDGLAATLGEAIDLPLEEQRARMEALRRTVARWNVDRWARGCLQSLGL